MWWTIAKFGLLIFLALIVFAVFAGLLAKKTISDSLNNKMMGTSRDTPDIVIQEFVPNSNEEEELDAGYNSDDDS